jgi:hypothetical protein
LRRVSSSSKQTGENFCLSRDVGATAALADRTSSACRFLTKTHTEPIMAIYRLNHVRRIIRLRFSYGLLGCHLNPPDERAYFNQPYWEDTMKRASRIAAAAVAAFTSLSAPPVSAVRAQSDDFRMEAITGKAVIPPAISGGTTAPPPASTAPPARTPVQPPPPLSPVGPPILPGQGCVPTPDYACPG